MTVRVDMFSDEAKRLTDNGWVLTYVSRYDPTVVEGVTPSGKVFAFRLDRDGTAELGIATNKSRRTVSAQSHEDASGTVSLLLSLQASLPVDQR